MKKLIFVILMVFLSFSVFAQNWSFGGEIYSNYYKWDNSETSEDSNEFYFGISVARYLSEKISVGINGSFDFFNKGNVISFGPFFQYDFLKHELFSFGFFGSFLYSIYNDSYEWNDTYNNIDANRISLNGSIRFNFMPNKNIELYMNILSISFRHYWLTLPDYNLKCAVDNFIISPLISNNVLLGIKFKI
jgi:hypothetical protein